MTSPLPTQGVEALVERLNDPNFANEFQHLRPWSEIQKLHNEAAQALTNQAEHIKTLEEAARNAAGFLDTPVSRRRNAGDNFYVETVQSLRQALSALQGDDQ